MHGAARRTGADARGRGTAMSDTPKKDDLPVMPCPFCGGKAKIEFKHGQWGYTSHSVIIQCRPCGIAFHEKAENWEPGRGMFSIRDEAEEKLLKRWNTRHQDGSK